MYFRMLIVDMKPTKSKEIDPVVEEQEEQQFSDGTDGPSNRCSQSRILRVLAHKFQKKRHKSGNIHFNPQCVSPAPWVDVPKMTTKWMSFAFLGSSPAILGRPQNQLRKF